MQELPKLPNTLNARGLDREVFLELQIVYLALQQLIAYTAALEARIQTLESL